MSGGVDGGIVTGQVTASIDGLTREHLQALRGVLEAVGQRQPIIDVRMAVVKALAEWDAHLEHAQAPSEISEEPRKMPPCGNFSPHHPHSGNPDQQWCAGVPA